MKIFLYEHISGGGFRKEALPKPLAAEGLAMLVPLVEGFYAIPDVEVTLLLDSRISTTLFPPVHIHPVDKTFESPFRNALKKSDAALVIAPETDGVLLNLTRKVERAGVINLGCSSKSVSRFGDKSASYRALKKIGLPLPSTIKYLLDCDVKKVCKSHSFPFVVKPLHGVASEGVYVIQNKVQFESALKEFKKNRLGPEFLVQEYIPGFHRSAILLGNSVEQKLISTNIQIIFKGAYKGKVKNLVPNPKDDPDFFTLQWKDDRQDHPERFEYLGSVVPVELPDRSQLDSIVHRIHENHPGLNGFWGIDFVLSGNEIKIIEINPRPTTSLFAASSLISNNCSALLLNHVLKESPVDVRMEGSMTFTKVDLVNKFFL